MTLTIQAFTCPRCNRGEFRSLPGTDGKAYCPWCGDAVLGSVAPGSDPLSAPEGAAAPVVTATLEELLERVARNAPEDAVRALRDRLADLNRKREQAESDLRQELDKKVLIKKAVMEEVGRLGSQMGETRVRLKQTEEEHQSATSEMFRVKAELEKEREKTAELSASRASLESELEERRKAVRELKDASDVARRDAEQMLAHLDKSRATSAAELADLRKKIAAYEARLATQKAVETELNGLKPKLRDQQRLEKERAEFQEKASTLQAAVGKKDERIRELQLLIKTLGERLNDLSSRHP
jgi:chromosome segregation ATPase